MAKLALTFYSLLDIPIKDVVECYQAAEKSGFTYGVMSESAGRDAMVILTSAVAKTKTLKFGTNIIPIYVRSPMQTAASALTLHEVSDGRFQLLGPARAIRSAWSRVRHQIREPAVRPGNTSRSCAC